MVNFNFDSNRPKFFKIGSTNPPTQMQEQEPEIDDDLAEIVETSDSRVIPFSTNGQTEFRQQMQQRANNGTERSATASAAMRQNSHQNSSRNNRIIENVEEMPAYARVRSSFDTENNPLQNQQQNLFKIPPIPVHRSKTSHSGRSTPDSIGSSSPATMVNLQSSFQPPMQNHGHLPSPTKDSTPVGRILSFLSTNLTDNEKSNQDRILKLEKSVNQYKSKYNESIGKIKALITVNASQHEKLDNFSSKMQSLDEKYLN